MARVAVTAGRVRLAPQEGHATRRRRAPPRYAPGGPAPAPVPWLPAPSALMYRSSPLAVTHPSSASSRVPFSHRARSARARAQNSSGVVPNSARSRGVWP